MTAAAVEAYRVTDTDALIDAGVCRRQTIDRDIDGIYGADIDIIRHGELEA